jgi:hypothetical protein
MRAARLWLAMLACCTTFPVDPVRDEAVAALGPEQEGVPPGPLHRPGQPCVLCHSPAGGATALSLGGTVYRRNDATDGFGGAEVLLVDGAGAKFRARTNCVGNFFVTPEQYTPTFPVWVTIRYGDTATDMKSMIHRDGSCASCHSDPASPTSAGHVFVTSDPIVVLAPTPCGPNGGGQR